MSGRLIHRPWPSVVATVIGSAVLGALAGVLWERLWTPPTGFAWKGRFYLDGAGLTKDIAGPMLYVLVAAAAALLLGVVVAFLPADPRVKLVLLLFGAGLGTLTMLVVGAALGPPNAAVLAQDAADGTPLLSDLHVVGLSPYLAWPAGALAGYLTFVMVRR